jgi:hypothetical protein
VIELIVTSKPTTEASGASSPVTNTAPDDCEEGDVADDELEDEPQLAANRQSASKNVIPKHRFMTKLQFSDFVKFFLGEPRFASR